MAVLLWTVVPLAALHLVLWRRSRGVLRFQLVADVLHDVPDLPAEVQRVLDQIER